MVDASDFLGPDEFAEDEDEAEAVDITEDFAALRDCLQALADAIASTNLAVINAVQQDGGGASARVTASVQALKRFHDAFKILKDEGPTEEDEEV